MVRQAPFHFFVELWYDVSRDEFAVLGRFLRSRVDGYAHGTNIAAHDTGREKIAYFVAALIRDVGRFEHLVYSAH